MVRSFPETTPFLGRFKEPGVIDCDGHIFEPLDLWQNYLEPQYQERGLRLRQ